ncbi:hypothetical protein P154DRAFT_992 [Amniculicola lignicola CBS 123094]|uniref:Uncharacterized protein n=1 Tax=Amniculicola lignicola CBS 123094 TaxID=1392246 RepID=A0A6A5X4D5_9PLEO|nr:hypothetical protein P154DRAFT_992 [Amniculicola lignicola CBS 123094]
MNPLDLLVVWLLFVCGAFSRAEVLTFVTGQRNPSPTLALNVDKTVSTAFTNASPTNSLLALAPEPLSTGPQSPPLSLVLTGVPHGLAPPTLTAPLESSAARSPSTLHPTQTTPTHVPTQAASTPNPTVVRPSATLTTVIVKGKPNFNVTLVINFPAPTNDPESVKARLATSTVSYASYALFAYSFFSGVALVALWAIGWIDMGLNVCIPSPAPPDPVISPILGCRPMLIFPQPTNKMPGLRAHPRRHVQVPVLVPVVASLPVIRPVSSPESVDTLLGGIEEEDRIVRATRSEMELERRYTLLESQMTRLGMI